MTELTLEADPSTVHIKHSFLSAKIKNILAAESINTFAELSKYTLNELSEIPGLGKGNINAIVLNLTLIGLSLQTEDRRRQERENNFTISLALNDPTAREVVTLWFKRNLPILGVNDTRVNKAFLFLQEIEKLELSKVTKPKLSATTLNAEVQVRESKSRLI